MCPEPQTCQQLFTRQINESRHLATGLTALDQCLRGGLPAGTLTEFVGPAGAGKTQLCLQCAACSQAESGAVIYIDTESRFSAQRLVELASARFPSRFCSEEAQSTLTRNVAVFSPANATDLGNLIQSLESLIIERAAKLVIIDSIAALMRADFARERLIERQAMLGEYAARLKRLAEAFRIPILVTNQVTGGSVSLTGQGDGGAGGGVAAAMGTKWAHDINLRLMLEMDGGRRCITISKSAAAPALSFPYEIATAGLQLTAPGFEASFVTADGAFGGLSGAPAALDITSAAFFAG